MKYVKVAIYSLITLFVAECSTAQIGPGKLQRVKGLVAQSRQTKDIPTIERILGQLRQQYPTFTSHIQTMEHRIAFLRKRAEEEDAQLALHLGAEQSTAPQLVEKYTFTTTNKAHVNTVSWSTPGAQLAAGVGLIAHPNRTTQTAIYLLNNAGQCTKQIKRHQNTVRSVEWHPDGQRIVSGADDKIIRVIDSDTGRQLHQFNGSNTIWSVRCNKDGRRIASEEIGTVNIWDLEANKALRRLKGSTACASDWHPDNERIAVGSPNQSIFIWDTRTKDSIQTINNACNPHNNPAALRWNQDGVHLASSCYDGIVRLWDIRNNQCTQRFATDRRVLPASVALNLVRSLDWHPDGRRLAAGCDNKSAYVLDIFNNRCIQKFSDPGCIYATRWSPDGQRLAMGSSDGTVHIWEYPEGEDPDQGEGSDSDDGEADEDNNDEEFQRAEEQERSRRSHEAEELQLAQALSASLGDQGRAQQAASTNTGTPLPDKESKHERDDERRGELQRERDRLEETQFELRAALFREKHLRESREKFHEQREEDILERARQIAQDEIRRARERDIEEIRQSDYIVEEPDDDHNALVASQRGSGISTTLQQRLEAAQHAHQLALTQASDAEQRAIELRKAQDTLNDRQQAARESRQIAASPSVPQLEHIPQDNGANLQQQLEEAEGEHRSAVARAQYAQQHITELQQEREQLIQQLRTAQEERRNSGARLTIVEAELQRLIDHARALQQTEERSQTLQASLTEAQQVIEELKSQLEQQKEAEKKEDVDPSVSAGALVALQVRRDQPQSEEVHRETQRFMTLMQSAHDDAQVRIDLIKGELERLRADRDVRDRWIEHLTHQLYTSEQSARIQATLQTILEDESSDDES